MVRIPDMHSDLWQVWAYPALSFLFTLAGHTNWVRSIACSPSGHQAVSGSDDNTVRVWYALPYHPACCTAELKSGISDLQVIAANHATASLSTHLTTRQSTPACRDLNTRQSMAVLRDHADRVNTVAWHPEGLSFATAGAEGCIKVCCFGISAMAGTVWPALKHALASAEAAHSGQLRIRLPPCLAHVVTAGCTSPHMWDIVRGRLHSSMTADSNPISHCHCQ